MNTFTRGLAGGAAGTIALDLATYTDMLLTGRPASSAPAELVRRMAETLGCDQLATADESADDQTKNRRSAIGAILGMKVGCWIGVGASLCRPLLSPLPRIVQAAIVGGAAMAASDLPLARFGVSDPKTWSQTDWLRDAVPHFLYGWFTTAVIDGIAEADA